MAFLHGTFFTLIFNNYLFSVFAFCIYNRSSPLVLVFVSNISVLLVIDASFFRNIFTLPPRVPVA